VTGRSTKILVVDDEAQIRRALRIALRANGFEVLEAADGGDALDRAAAEPPDLVVLDLSLPGLGGVDVCRRLRQWSQVPVIVVSAARDDETKVAALDAGADDYLTKPFSMVELLARMRMALRRADRPAGGVPIVRAGAVEVDLARRVVTRAGQEVHLTPTEFSLLRFLARNAGRVVTHGQLAREVLGPVGGESAGNLRVYVSGLRRKLEGDAAHPELLVTEPGIGYRLRAD
jgi:two-component system KDP operon response regulator KdpE